VQPAASHAHLPRACVRSHGSGHAALPHAQARPLHAATGRGAGRGARAGGAHQRVEVEADLEGKLRHSPRGPPMRHLQPAGRTAPRRTRAGAPADAMREDGRRRTHARHKKHLFGAVGADAVPVLLRDGPQPRHELFLSLGIRHLSCLFPHPSAVKALQLCGVLVEYY
jgi:hypothetical protein